MNAIRKVLEIFISNACMAWSGHGYNYFIPITFIKFYQSNAHNINEFIIEMILTPQDYLAIGVGLIVTMIICVCMYDRCMRYE